MSKYCRFYNKRE